MSRDVYFKTLASRLIIELNQKIAQGNFTERGLARMVGISQTQMHHILKGARRLKPEVADLIMWRLQVSILDLLGTEETSRGEKASL